MAIHASLREAIAAEKTQVENRVKTPDRILLLMQQHPDYSMADMANTLGLPVSTVERAVSKLKQAQRVQYIGSKKGGYWQVIDPT